MFNLKKHNKPIDLFQAELNAFDIHPSDGGYSILVGDENFSVDSLEECSFLIHNGISELKEHLWSLWQDLQHLSTVIRNNEGGRV